MRCLSLKKRLARRSKNDAPDDVDALFDEDEPEPANKADEDDVDALFEDDQPQQPPKISEQQAQIAPKRRRKLRAKMERISGETSLDHRRDANLSRRACCARSICCAGDELLSALFGVYFDVVRFGHSVALSSHFTSSGSRGLVAAYRIGQSIYCLRSSLFLILEVPRNSAGVLMRTWRTSG